MGSQVAKTEVVRVVVVQVVLGLDRLVPGGLKELFTWMVSGAAREGGRWSPQGLEMRFEDEGALVAVRTLEWIGAGEGFEEFRPGLRLLRFWIWGHEQKNPGP